MKEILAKKIITLIFITIFCFDQVLSQSGNDFINDIKKVVSAPPNAAELGKYGEIPVSLNTGTPQISIPLYTIKGNNLTLPLSLSYHGSGFRVSEVSSWVGLGWVLNAGGVISRTVRGWPDDIASAGYFFSYNTYINSIKDNPCVGSNPFSVPCSWRIRASHGEFDLEPDIYSFNFNGYSGRIQFNADRIPLLIPYQDLKIEHHPFVGTGGANQWVIIAPDGTKYIFNETEVSSFRYGGSYTTSWYLSDIVCAKSDERIHLSYASNEGQWYERLSILPSYIALNPIISNQDLFPMRYPDLTSETERTYSTKLLDSITFEDLVVTLLINDDRQDIGGESAERRLTDLVVKKSSGQDLASFTFNNNAYFTGSDNVGNLSYLNKRLKLESVSDNLSLTKYSFSYNELYQMPSYESPDIDHWGYYNNANNTSFIPNPGLEFDAEFYPSNIATANRESDPLATQACMLTKISYPTGGSTQFTWEPHVIDLSRDNIKKQIEISVSSSNGELLMNVNERSLANYLQELVVDDPSMPVNIKIQPFVKKQDGYVYFNVSTSNPAVGYCRAYIYNFNIPYDDDIDLEKCRVFMYDVFNSCWTSNCQILDGTMKHLEDGVYALIAIVSKNTSQNMSINASVQFEDYELIPFRNGYVGGVRIKQIIDHDGMDHEKDLLRTFVYRQNYLEPLPENAPVNYERSSLTIFPEFYPSIYNYSYKDPVTNKRIITSTLIDSYGIPIRFDGSHVGYSEVAEISSGNENGIRLIKYRNMGIPEYRGLVKEEYFLDKDLSPVKLTINNYSGYSFGQNVYSKFIKLLRANVDCGFGGGCLYDLEFYDPSPSSINPLWFGLTNTTSKIHGTNGIDNVETVSNFSYGGAQNGKHSLLTQRTDISSDETSHIIKYRYPTDFSTSTNILGTMREKNIINEPVEFQIWKDDKLLSARYNKYKLFSNFVALHESYRLESAQPLTLNSFTGLDQNGDLPTNTNYTKFLVNDYNASGLLINQQKVDDVPISYIWGYNQTYPIAKLDNIESSLISLTLKNLIEQLDDYTELNDSNDRDDLKELNETIRSVAPENAFITTYTYSPHIGITSQTDSNGATTYYEYDGLGRLKCIRNDDYNILKTYDYHYQE